MKKIGRNDPCPCGSGKKFKKCCESKMLGRRYMATKLDQNADMLTKTSGLTSFFQNNITAPSLSNRKITASLTQNPNAPKPPSPEEKKAESPSKKEDEKKSEEENT